MPEFWLTGPRNLITAVILPETFPFKSFSIFFAYKDRSWYTCFSSLVKQAYRIVWTESNWVNLFDCFDVSVYLLIHFPETFAVFLETVQIEIEHIHNKRSNLFHICISEQATRCLKNVLVSLWDSCLNFHYFDSCCSHPFASKNCQNSNCSLFISHFKIGQSAILLNCLGPYHHTIVEGVKRQEL